MKYFFTFEDSATLFSPLPSVDSWLATHFLQRRLKGAIKIARPPDFAVLSLSLLLKSPLRVLYANTKKSLSMLVSTFRSHIIVAWRTTASPFGEPAKVFTSSPFHLPRCWIKDMKAPKGFLAKSQGKCTWRKTIDLILVLYGDVMTLWISHHCQIFRNSIRTLHFFLEKTAFNSISPWKTGEILLKKRTEASAKVILGLWAIFNETTAPSLPSSPFYYSRL